MLACYPVSRIEQASETGPRASQGFFRMAETKVAMSNLILWQQHMTTILNLDGSQQRSMLKGCGEPHSRGRGAKHLARPHY